MEILRTPDERFAGLPGFAFAPRYVERRRPAHALRRRGPARGAGRAAAARRAVVVLSLSQDDPDPRRGRAPRRRARSRRLRPLRQARAPRGLHAISATWTGWRGFVAALDLRDITLVCQDWGGLLGLRLVGENPRASRAWWRPTRSCRPATRRRARPSSRGASSRRRRRALPRGRDREGRLRHAARARGRRRLRRALPRRVATRRARASSRCWCRSRPTIPRPRPNRAAWEVLERFEKPFLTAFSDLRPDHARLDAPLQARIPGAQGQPHTTHRGGGHFLQEDSGEELAQVVVDFVRRTGGR